MLEPTFANVIRPRARTKVDSVFLDEGYAKLKETGYAWHPGWDWNLKTGGNSDLGYPVNSCFPGTVVSAAPGSGVWGNIVLIRADEWVRAYFEAALKRSLKVLDLQLAHLHQMTVVAGDRVEAGDCVGSIGAGGWPHAHLHQEFRGVPLRPDNWYGRNKLAVQRDYLDPEQVFCAARFEDHSNILPSRQLMLPVPRLNLNGNFVDCKRVIVNGGPKTTYVRSE